MKGQLLQPYISFVLSFSFPLCHICLLLASQFPHSSLLDFSFFLSPFLLSPPMAFKKIVQPKILGELGQPEVCTSKQVYAGYLWRSEVTHEFLSSLFSTYHVPETMVFKVPGLQEGAIDAEGFASHVALFPSSFSYRLWLPFLCPFATCWTILSWLPPSFTQTLGGF